jgi:hypothetical protein
MQFLKQEIMEAMTEIANETCGNFYPPQLKGGLGNNDGEASFKNALCTKLNQSTPNWCWTTEAQFRTTAILNNGTIAIDIAGKNQQSGASFFIELKYVAHRLDANGVIQLRPNDPPAFPYDILKDCLKLELIHKNLAQSKEYTKPAGGIIIGLTNWGRYWNQGAVRNWARNSHSTINSLLVRPQLINTVKQDEELLARTIFRHKRPHISLGATWAANWHDLPFIKGIETQAPKFKYLLMSLEDFENISYQHCHSDPSFIPFLNLAVRCEFLAKREYYKLQPHK